MYARLFKTALLLALIILSISPNIMYSQHNYNKEYFYIDPTSSYSVSIVLNKPGLRVDLRNLKRMHGVVEVDYNIPFMGLRKALLYRSHYSGLFFVIISFEPIDLLEHKPKLYPVITITPYLDFENITGYGFILEGVLGIGDFKEFVLEFDKRGFSIEDFMETDVVSSAKCVYSHKDYDTVLYIDYHIRYGVIRITASVNASIDVLMKDLEILNEFKFENISFSKYYPIYAGLPPKREAFIKGYARDLEEALLNELSWLIDNGVVYGLSLEDVKEAFGESIVGYCGWNNRLVYNSNRWTKYSSLKESIHLLTGQSCRSWIPFRKIPLNPPIISTTIDKLTTLEENYTTRSSYSKEGVYREGYNILYTIIAIILVSIIAIGVYLTKRKPR